MATDNETIQATTSPPVERLAYSIEEAAQMLGINYHSIYRLIQRGKLKACRALRGKFLISRDELLKLLKSE
jgi:excisionase family DNA binding protein